MGRVLGYHHIFAFAGQADDLIGVAHAIHFHAWRTHGHARCGDAQQVVTLAQGQHLIGRHVAFNEFAVRPDGVISIPNIGRIKAALRTPEDLGKEITDKYKRIYREPAVTVNIASAPSNKVFIGGAVPNPAFFDLAGNVSVEQALLSSGGVLASADASNVALMRTGPDGKYKTYFISLNNMLTDPNHPRVALQRGDLIYVPQSGIGATVEAVDMYFTRLFPINKGIGVGLNYDLNDSGVKNSGNTIYNNPVINAGQ